MTYYDETNDPWRSALTDPRSEAEEKRHAEQQVVAWQDVWPGQQTTADMFDLKSRVGYWEKNRPDDVAKVQLAIHNAGHTDLDISEGPTGIFGKPDHDGLMDLQRERGLNIDGKVAPGGETISNLKQSAFPGSLSRINNPISDHEQQFQTAPGDQNPEFRQTADRTDVANDASNTEGGSPKKDCRALWWKLRELNKQIMKEGSKLAELKRRIHNQKIEIEQLEVYASRNYPFEEIGEIAGGLSRSKHRNIRGKGSIIEILAKIGEVGSDKITGNVREDLFMAKAVLKSLERRRSKLESKVNALEEQERHVKQKYDECRDGSGP